jgi:hypothetical protein
MIVAGWRGVNQQHALHEFATIIASEDDLARESNARGLNRSAVQFERAASCRMLLLLSQFGREDTDQSAFQLNDIGGDD